MAEAGIRDPALERRKSRAAAVSLIYNVALAAIKIAAAVLTGSVSILSEAVHSSVDVVASLMAFFGIRAAAAPPDDEHPYGHGKIESLAGFGESLLLLMIVCFVLIEAVVKLRGGGEVANLGLGIGVMALSVATSALVANFMLKAAKETQSLALESNGRHLMADFWTSVGVLAALAATAASGWRWVDPVAAIAIAVWMAWGAVRLANKAVQHLIDRRLSDEEIAKINALILESPEILGHHRLRSRHSGNVRYVDLHIVVPNDWSVVQAHAVADAMEKRIAEGIQPAHVVIHVDPFDPAKVKGS